CSRRARGRSARRAGGRTKNCHRSVIASCERNPSEERMQFMTPDRRLRTAVKYGWTRLISASRPRYRFNLRRQGRHPAMGALVEPLPESIDPVALTVLAVNRLGPATLRTVANGKPLTVTVPNERIGEIFRAALAEMQKAPAHRPPDRYRDCPRCRRCCVRGLRRRPPRPRAGVRGPVIKFSSAIGCATRSAWARPMAEENLMTGPRSEEHTSELQS